MSRHVILGKENDPDSGEPMFWSKQYGWIDLESATVFTDNEVAVFDCLPTESWGWLTLPDTQEVSA